MEQIINNVGWLLELIMIEICMHIVWNRKFQFNFWIFMLCCYNGIVFILITNGLVPYLCKYIIYVVIFAQCYCEFKLTFVKTVINFLIAITIAGLLEVISAFIITIPFIKIIKSESELLLMVNTISVILSGILQWVVCGYKNSLILKIRDKKIYRIVIICTMPFIVMVVDYSVYHTIRLIYDLLIVALIVVVYCYLLKVQKTESELERKDLELELQRIYSATYQELVTEVRQRQHDYKNQLTAIYSMHLVAESLEDLVSMQREYCDKLKDNSQYDMILTKCSEPILAGYLYYKCLACEKAGVQIEYNINIGQISCRLTLHELIEIIGIFIDNACEQVLKEISEDKRIVMELQENAENVIFEIRNPTKFLTNLEIEKMFETGYSTKGENRGLGLPRAKQIVKKRHLELIVSNLEQSGRNWLFFKLIIKNKAN